MVSRRLVLSAGWRVRQQNNFSEDLPAARSELAVEGEIIDQICACLSLARNYWALSYHGGDNLFQCVAGWMHAELAAAEPKMTGGGHQS